MNMFDIGNYHPILTISFLYKMGNDLVNGVMELPQVQELLESNEKFDVCVIESFNADAFLVKTAVAIFVFFKLNIFNLRASLIASIVCLSVTLLLEP
jgi:hypothetical protein